MSSIKDSKSAFEWNPAFNKKRTRRRVIKCCENCRSSKNKCSKHPVACDRCLQYQLNCVYLPQDDEGWEVIEKGKEEHRKIENRIAKRARREENPDEESEDGSDMEPSPLIAIDATYEDDDEIEDKGIRIGRFNLTRRIGSYYRPKMIEEMSQMLDVNDLQRSDYERQEFHNLPRPHWLDAAVGPKVLDPGPDYIAPSLFSHTSHVNQPVRKILRSKDLADQIMKHYWECVHPVACLLHRLSFQERYDIFWYNSSREAKDTPESTQALVYATLFAGVVSMNAKTVREELGCEREQLVETLEKAAAISLSGAHVIRTEKLETIQAFVMYLIPMCRSIVSRTLATLIASAIDLARGMGLNKDGTYYGYDAVVIQVQRMIWHQLCFLDIRVCEAQSPRARIRKDEFNTQLPLNVEDSELESSDLSGGSSDRWTAITLFSARMECNQKIMEIYAARQQTRQGDESESAYIRTMLGIIYEFEQYMGKKYYPMIDDRIPVQHYTRLIIDLHCRRMHGIVLHEYHMSTPRGRMPEQLSRIVIKSGLETMEIAKEIETSDSLRPWRWYAGALQQHSLATLMLIEVFGFPGTEYAKRAWESLDWIFQVPSCIPQNHKGRWVLEGAVGVMKEYFKVRKLRCPIFMDERLGIAPSSPRRPKWPQSPVTSNTRAYSQDVEMGSATQGMPSPPDTSPDEFMDITSPWQSVVDSNSSIGHLGYSPGDNPAGPSDYPGSETARHGRGDVEEASSAGSSRPSQDHTVYYHHDIWVINDTPPPGLSYSWHDGSPYDHSSSDSYNNDSQVPDEDSYVPFQDHASSATPRVPSAFTPTNQNDATSHPLQHCYGARYA